MDPVNLLPSGSYKFRENHADSVVFHTANHTPDFPETVTITRVLPTPRKNNAGTLKIMGNIRTTIDIGTDESPKIVPVITKFETSLPVGASYLDLSRTFSIVKGIMVDDDPLPGQISSPAIEAATRLFSAGVLPDNGWISDSDGNAET